MSVSVLPLTILDYDAISALWNSVGMSKRALNSVDDSLEGIERYLKRNPNTCFKAVTEDGQLVGVILSGHDGRRGIVHHLCVNPDFQCGGIGSLLVKTAEEALQKEGIQKIFILVFEDNEKGNAFWEKTGLQFKDKSELQK